MLIVLKFVLNLRAVNAAGCVDFVYSDLNTVFNCQSDVYKRQELTA